MGFAALTPSLGQGELSHLWLQGHQSTKVGRGGLDATETTRRRRKMKSQALINTLICPPHRTAAPVRLTCQWGTEVKRTQTLFSLSTYVEEVKDRWIQKTRRSPPVEGNTSSEKGPTRAVQEINAVYSATKSWANK
ncbi:unnamed protein product [Heligmosomoides polygyrus]|uniref:Uncharacterized protein n=1 Tax=Heligmosomoides polygyrus TaxID=6339 RepID=A0A183GDW5_HELPZ|nr:unnamed protein product [Heligmosomoides polygyrus]